MPAASLSLAVLLALGASVSWALANLAVARTAKSVGAVRGLLWAEVAGGALALVVGAVVDRRAAAFSPATFGLLAGAGVAALLAYLSMFYALEHGRLSIAVPIMSGWAVISTGISVLLLREPVHPSQLAGAGLVIAGVALVSSHAHRSAGAAARAAAGGAAAAVPRWVWASLATAVGFGVLMPFIGRIARVTGSVGSVAAVFGADLLLGLPLAVWFRVDLRPPPRSAVIPAALAGLFEASGFVCIALASAHAPLAVVSPLASLASALTVLYAWVVLRERPHWVALAGAALACAGVIVLAS